MGVVTSLHCPLGNDIHISVGDLESRVDYGVYVGDHRRPLSQKAAIKVYEQLALASYITQWNALCCIPTNKNTDH